MALTPALLQQVRTLFEGSACGRPARIAPDGVTEPRRRTFDPSGARPVASCGSFRVREYDRVPGTGPLPASGAADAE